MKTRAQKCLRCGHISNSGNIWEHMKRVHGEGMKKGINYEYIGEKKRETRSTKNTKPDVDFKCLNCGVIYRSSNGMWQHLKSAHNERMERDKTYILVPKTDRNRQSTNKETYTKRKPLVVIPNSKYIDIQAIIRIPITVGQVQILPIE